MSDNTIFIEPLTAEAFAPFGQVIQTEGAQHFPINNGKTERFHDLAQVQLAGPSSRPIISIARGQPYSLPLTLAMVERHPFGSQAFHPLSNRPFLVIVAPDENGTPGRPRAFLTAPGQGINYAINTWHGVLTPLDVPADFLLVDRAGDGPNLEEYFYPTPWQVVAAS
ncbi:ureidoglycolate lyase [Devosia sp. 1566]|uniref:ureidoglycolate lyase n=1 Tax=Devosia sp. 1566 TaxID=2499144 RepID=UPI000FD95668|nr:ureidoglycolate lyase [Devosia sp. 1566]